MHTEASDGGVVTAVPAIDRVMMQVYGGGDEDGCSARKRLINTDGTVSVRGQPVPNLVGKVSSTVLMLEGGNTSDGVELGPSSTPGKVPIVKRRKQGDGEDTMEMDMASEAAFEREDRRAQ